MVKKLKILKELDDLTLGKIDKHITENAEQAYKFENVGLVKNVLENLVCANCGKDGVVKVSPKKTMDELTLMECPFCHERCYKKTKEKE